MESGGLQIQPDSASYIGGSIQRVNLRTQAFETLYTACDGQALIGPNDIVFDATGNFWFTDFGKSDGTKQIFGGIYYASVDGKMIRCERAGLLSPNGIGLSPDGTWLYWTDTYTGRLWRCALTAPGTLKTQQHPLLPGEVVKTLPGFQLLDSLAVEAGGNICVATIFNGGITIFTPEGESEHMPLDDLSVTNICFGGVDQRTAWITAASTGRVLQCRWPRPGARLEFTA
jgi:gluconolactonase